VFPGTEVTEKTDPELYRAFVTAMEKRRVVGLKDQSGWSLTYMANVFARLGNGDTAEECLAYLSRSNVMNNFVTVHNDWRRMGIAICNDYRNAPVQLDANMGLTAALQEMALFSTRGEIDLFHAIPADWDRCKIGPISAKTGTLVWEEMGEGGITATLRQAHGNATFLLSAGAGFAFADGKGDRTVTLAEGEEMTLSLQRNAT
jgi:alpha-L-fucosidase 2